MTLTFDLDPVFKVKRDSDITPIGPMPIRQIVFDFEVFYIEIVKPKGQ